MLDNKSSYIKLVLILFFFFFLFSVYYFRVDERKNLESVLSYIDEDEEIIVFSHDNGYYKDTIDLKMSLNKKIPNTAKIYYTLDGNTPNKDSNLYKDKIKLKKEKDKTKVYQVSAVLFYGDEYSKIIQKTYVIDEEIDKIYDIPIINIISSPYNFYDNVHGLMADRNRHLRHKEDAKVVKLMMFDKNGKIKIDQNVGILVSGNASSSLKVKSFKIMADDDYDEKDYFEYTFPTDEVSFSIPHKYKNLRLASGGQDYMFSNIRNSSVYKLAKESNFDGYKDNERVVVFINGEFYSVMSIEQSLSDSFIKGRYNLNNKKIKKIKGSEIDFFKNIGLYDEIRENINDETVQKRIEEQIDVDDFLLYNAIELISNNSDWPQKNFEAWKYTGKNEKNNKYKDGKYRFLLYDLDFTYFNYDISLWTHWGVGRDNFLRIENNREYVLRYFFKVEKYRNKFVNIINNLINTSFNENNVIKVFTDEYNLIKDESMRNLEDDNAILFNENFEKTIGAIKERNGIIFDDLYKFLDIKDSFNIKLKTSKGSYVQIENIYIYENQEINYEYNSNDVIINAYSNPGYKFKYFIVDGKKIRDDTIHISEDCYVEVISEKESNNDIIIKEIKSNGSDYVVLKNISEKIINLKNYYISDKKSNLKKYELLSKKLHPGEEITLYGKSNLDTSFGDSILSFNIKKNEYIILYNSKNKNIDDMLLIPDLNKNEIYFRYNDSNIFKIRLKK